MANTSGIIQSKNFLCAELFPLCMPNGFQKKSPKDCNFLISICSISSYRCTTERSQKYGFGRYFLLQPMLQANCFLLINTYTVLCTTIIWATHHLPQVDHYLISLIECSRPILIFLISSDLIWNLHWWNCYISNPNNPKMKVNLSQKRKCFICSFFPCSTLYLYSFYTW